MQLDFTDRDRPSLAAAAVQPSRGCRSRLATQQARERFWTRSEQIKFPARGERRVASRSRPPIFSDAYAPDLGIRIM